MTGSANRYGIAPVGNIRVLDMAFVGMVIAAVVTIGLAVADLAWGGRHHSALTIAIAVAGAVLALLLILTRWAAARMRSVEIRQIDAEHDARDQIMELFAMTDMLQAAETYEDASNVLAATARRLLPKYGVALYIFNNSRDRLDLACSWNMPGGADLAETLPPGTCWALKRGKPHINSVTDRTLRCAHHDGEFASAEIPMMACGQLHGLLILTLGEEAGAFERLVAIRRLGRALADSMSLALSNIALREKLRTQSLRDPLTGLYNRRYMEDALERLVSLGQRTGGSVAVLMFDLDNFKRLNDEQGHAKGDAVLRDVAGQLIGALRPSDVVCRYGGEELVAILPDCPPEDAMEKAEVLRQRIEALTSVHQYPISASIGVAVVPDSATSATDVLPIADAALYQAKKAGKNQVKCADRRSSRDVPAPRLAAIKTAQG